MKYKSVSLNLSGIFATSLVLAADEPPKWITEGPHVSEAEFYLELPLTIFANQLFVDIEVDGSPRRFLFDTGSPSMMNTALAEELELEVIDRRQGRDSHGAVVETGVVQSDLTLGGTTFHKVPIFVADFPKPPKCLFDGVLGSEILPLCAWQIDVPESVLRCNTNREALDHVDEENRQQLYDFGYPHAPILDIRFAENATSKALFDTGSPEYFAISPPDFEGARRNGAVGKTREGTGSIGGSVGGVAPEQQQLRMRLNTLAVGDIGLEDVDAILRESPPSLIGASILDHFVVTLDMRNSAAYFDAYRNGPFDRPSYGFSLRFDGSTRISLLWEGSPAQTAGLDVGQRVTAINGNPTDTSCDGIRTAMQAMVEGTTINITWEGGNAELARQDSLLE